MDYTLKSDEIVIQMSIITPLNHSNQFYQPLIELTIS